MKKVLMAMLAVFAITIVTGCRNTAQGVGEDVEKAGDKIQEKTR
jgi:predicted small secreted protein